MRMHRWTMTAALVTAATIPATLAGQRRPPESQEEISLDSLLAVPVSTAAKHVQLAAEAPAAVTVLTGDEIARMGYRTIIEVLAAVRGFYLTDDRNYTYVGVRGLSRPSDYNNRLLVLIDGHRMSEGFYGGTGLEKVALDPGIIERVEIVRGPGSVLYGTSAMFAVINIVTKSGAALDGARVSARAGSNATADLDAAWGRRVGRADVSVWGRYLRTDGETLRFAEFDSSATGGVAEGLDWERTWTAGSRATVGPLNLRGFVASREKGIPTASFDAVFGADEWTVDRRAFVEADLTRDVGTAGEFFVRAAWDGDWYRGWYPYDVLWRDATDAHRVEGEARLLWDPLPQHRLTADVEVQYHYRADYRLWDEESTYFDANFPFTQVMLSVQDEVTPASWIRLVGGLSHALHTDGPDATTPRVAVLLSPDVATTVKLLYGEGFRVPSAYERRYGGPSLDWELNPDLRPERLRTGELVVERRLSSVLFATASTYVNSISGLIDPVEVGDPPIGRFENSQDVRVLGSALEVTARTGAVMVRGSYAFQHAKDTQTDRRLSNAPLHLLRLSAHAAVGNLGTVAGEFRYDSGRQTLAGATTPAYAVIDVAARTAAFAGGFRATLRVTNLLDRANVVPAGFEHVPDVLPQARRRLLFGIEWAP